MSAEQRWAEALASWALPDRLMAQAVDDPWAIPVELFARYAESGEHERTPSRDRALEALPPGGSVLDVGCGAGAASLALAHVAGSAIGVDENAGMLTAFEALAKERDLTLTTVTRRWPDASPETPVADVVVCHHVLYNVPDLGAFARALSEHARSRVVVEITAEHPRTWTNVYFTLLHDLERPSRPTADDAVAVLRENRVDPVMERWTAPMRITDHRDILVSWLRRSLCLAPGREPEVEEALAKAPPPEERTLATIWWDVPA